MRGTLWALAKGFIPVFRFFESGDILPVLEVRTTPDDTAWIPWLTPSRMKASHLFHNPDLNMKLYFYSLVHEVTQDQIENSSERVAERKLCKILLFSNPRVQYRIKNQMTQDILYTSEWFYADA